MSGARNPEDCNGEEQESQALLPGQHARDQQRVGNVAARSRADASEQPEDLSKLSNRDVWRHFESTKRSAIFHLEQYLQHREIFREETGARVESQSLDLVLQSQAEAPRSFWDFKVARDNLLNELDMLSRLLDCLHSKSKKGLAAFYGIIVILAVAVKLTEYGKSMGEKVTWGTSVVGLGATAAYTVYRTAWYGSLSLCKPVIQRIYERTQENTLDETDGEELKSTRFQLLWWTSYLSTSKP